jgi:hypothetical protein
MARAAAILAGVTIALGSVAATGSQELTRAQADSMSRKLAAIMLRGETRPSNGSRLHTSFTEQEVNAYFHHLNKTDLPVGVVNPRLRIGEGGRVEGRAVVDLDAVRQSRSRGLLDPANLLMGSVEVQVAGKLMAANGQGVLEIDSAYLGALPVSKSILQTIVSHYTRTPDDPDGFDLDKPFTLPASIHAIQTRPGAATIIQ